jgi:two-component system nitrogen regulation response regulator NtrX
VPPLRERSEDIPLLVDHFVSELAVEYGKSAKTVDPGAMVRLRSHRWPGNVRELRNVIERVVIMAPGDVITEHDLAFLAGGSMAATLTEDVAAAAVPLYTARDQFEREYIVRQLAVQQGNISRTAEVLGVERSNLYRKMRAFGIAPSRRTSDSGEDTEEEAV